jgi:hypothetical protein
MEAQDIYQSARLFFPPPPLPQFTAEQLEDAPRTCGVYFLYCGRRLLYVGESLDVRTRLASHPHISRFDGVGVLLCDIHHRKRMEAFYIGLLDPPFNHQSTEACRKSKQSTRRRPREVGVMRRVFRHIQRNPGCSLSGLHRHVGWRQTSEQVAVILSRLESWRLVRRAVIQTGGRGKTVFYATSHGTEAVA